MSWLHATPLHGIATLALALGPLLLSGCAKAAGEPAISARSPEPVCPAGSGWDGAHCVRTLVVTEVTCPAGSTWDGARCVAPASSAPAPSTPAPSGTASTASASTAPVPAAIPPPPDRSTCDCAASDLMCMMKCSAVCKDGSAPGCTGHVPHASPPPAQGKEFDRAAASSALSAAASAAKGCPGVSSTGSVRVVFAPGGQVRSAVVQSGPFAGTPQGGCIAAAFRAARVPPFDGADVSVSKSFVIP